MVRMKDIIESVSPILVKPKNRELSVSLSKRFFLFQITHKLIDAVEDDPYLNFISALKYYKVLGRFLHGTLGDFYKDRNKMYFKDFFYDRTLYSLVKSDLERLYPEYKHIRMTITKRGLIAYDNYKPNSFNVLLLTGHAGTWVPENIDKKFSINAAFRSTEEDVGTDKIYGDLVLKKGGIWIDNKQSRFVIDFNREIERAIYSDNSEEWLDVVWSEKLTKAEEAVIKDSYSEFYFLISRTLDVYHFNIICDGHSMRDGPDRADISFATDCIPNFYMPIVHNMIKSLKRMGYPDAAMNKPYKAMNLLHWFKDKYPQVFIFSVEVNKKLYMNKARTRIYHRKLRKVADDLAKIIDIEVELNE